MKLKTHFPSDVTTPRARVLYKTADRGFIKEHDGNKLPCRTTNVWYSRKKKKSD